MRLKKEKVFQHIYGNVAFNDQRFNKLVYQLKRCLEQFLVAYDIEQDTVLQNRLLLRALEKRNHSSYEKKSEKAIKLMEQKPSKEIGVDDYLDLFQLNYDLWSNINTEKTAPKFQFFQAANENLDKYYFLNKLKILFEYQSANNIIADQFEIYQADNLVSLVSSHPDLKNHPTVQIFLLAIKMLKSNEEIDYLNLKNTFLASIDQLHKKDARDIFVLLFSFYSQGFNNGKLSFLKDSFELSKFAEAQGLLAENNRIRDIEYHNIALVGFHTGNFEWTDCFIEKYKPFLSPVNQILTYTYVKAFSCFKQKDYDEVIKLLNQIEYKFNLNLSMAVKIRTLRLRALFDSWETQGYSKIKEKNSLKSQVQQFNRFINCHKKLATKRKDAYLVFARFISQLIKVIERDSINSLIVTKRLLNQSTPIVFLDWLKIKINHLEIHLSTKEKTKK
jgi:hypothetical protein